MLLQDNKRGMASILLINKGIAGTFVEMGKRQKEFIGNSNEWFKKSELLAKEYFTVAKNIGLSGKRTATLTDNFNGAVRESLRLGGSLEDIRETFDTFAEETGRGRILSSEEAINIAKIAQGANLYASEATKMAEAFDLMGLSSQKTLDYINEAVAITREMGLNSNKVIKTLQSNMGGHAKL